MLQHLTLEAFLTLAKTAKRVAIFKEISADMITPISIFESLVDKMQHGAMLESGLHGPENGRHSFLSFDPIAKFQFKNGLSSIKVGSEISKYNHGNPFTLMRQLISQLNYVARSDIGNRINSAVGFISYDAVRIFESIPDKHPAEGTLPDILFNFYRTTLTFDHQQQKLLISILVEINDNPEEIYIKTLEEIAKIITTINKSCNHPIKEKVAEKLTSSIEIDIDDTRFMHLVERAKEYIINGDAFQIVLSRCFTQNYTASPFEIYRALRHVNPAPYMFYLPIENDIVIGASPERMVS